MEATSPQTMAKNGDRNIYFIISVILFIIVICASVFLWTLNNSLERQIASTNDKIAEYNKEIEKLSSNNDVAAYDIISANKTEIIKNIERSRAQNYITEAVSLSKKYKIAFNGFSFDGETINTNATYVNKDVKDDAIAGVTAFIKDFRTTKHPMFKLNPISSVAGDALRRSFDVAFEVTK